MVEGTGWINLNSAIYHNFIVICTPHHLKIHSAQNHLIYRRLIWLSNKCIFGKTIKMNFQIRVYSKIEKNVIVPWIELASIFKLLVDHRLEPFTFSSVGLYWTLNMSDRQTWQSEQFSECNVISAKRYFKDNFFEMYEFPNHTFIKSLLCYK